MRLREKTPPGRQARLARLARQVRVRLARLARRQLLLALRLGRARRLEALLVYPRRRRRRCRCRCHDAHISPRSQGLDSSPCQSKSTHSPRECLHTRRHARQHARLHTRRAMSSSVAVLLLPPPLLLPLLPLLPLPPAAACRPAAHASARSRRRALHQAYAGHMRPRMWLPPPPWLQSHVQHVHVHAHLMPCRM